MISDDTKNKQFCSDVRQNRFFIFFEIPNFSDRRVNVIQQINMCRLIQSGRIGFLQIQWLYLNTLFKIIQSGLFPRTLYNKCMLFTLKVHHVEHKTGEWEENSLSVLH